MPSFLASANGYDGSLMNNLQTLPEWYAVMGNPTGPWLGFINAVYWLGLGIFFPVAAWMSNMYGRKICIYIGYLFIIPGIALQAASYHASMFIVGRALMGCASGWFSSSAPL